MQFLFLPESVTFTGIAAFSATVAAYLAVAACSFLLFDEQPESISPLISITEIVFKYFIIIFLNDSLF